MYTLILLRHGQSVWNLENRFTGWTDVDLTDTGQTEARNAGKLLAEEGYDFDLAFTSTLKRAIHTLWLTMEEMDRLWVPVERSWRLNERHYGALQGLNKSETAEKHGEEQVLIWRRSFDTPPPALEKADPRWPGHAPMYARVDPHALPLAESLKDTIARFLPYWQDAIIPAILDQRKVLIAAHGNTLRALVKHLDNVSEEEIVGLNIPTGVPLIYELDENLSPISHKYLGDASAVKAKADAVANQGKA